MSRTVLVSTHFPVFEILIMNHPPRNVKFPFVSSQRFPSTRVIKTSTAQKRTQETRYDDCKAFPKPLTQNLISVFVSHQCRWSRSWTEIIMEYNRFCCLLIFMINLQTIFGEDDTIIQHRSKRQAFSPDVRFFLYTWFLWYRYLGFFVFDVHLNKFSLGFFRKVWLPWRENFIWSAT